MISDESPRRSLLVALYLIPIVALALLVLAGVYLLMTSPPPADEPVRAGEPTYTHAR